MLGTGTVIGMVQCLIATVRAVMAITSVDECWQWLAELAVGSGYRQVGSLL